MADITNLVGPEFKAMSEDQRNLMSERIENLFDAIRGIINAEVSNPEYSHSKLSKE